MCKYCEELESIYWNPYLGTSFVKEIYIEPDKTLTVRGCGTDPEFEYEGVNFVIDFCPKCGSSLREKSV